VSTPQESDISSREKAVMLFIMGYLRRT